MNNPNNGGRERLAAIGSKAEDIKAALPMLEKIIAIEGSKASVTVCQQTSPSYKQAVVAQCDAFILAHHANKAHQAIIDALEADEVLYGSLNPMYPQAIMQDYRDNFSHVALYLREAISKGFLSASKLPSEFKLS